MYGPSYLYNVLMWMVYVWPSYLYLYNVLMWMVYVWPLLSVQCTDVDGICMHGHSYLYNVLIWMVYVWPLLSVQCTDVDGICMAPLICTMY